MLLDKTTLAMQAHIWAIHP